MFHCLDSTCALVVEDKPLEKMVVMIIKPLSLKWLGCMTEKATGPFFAMICSLIGCIIYLIQIVFFFIKRESEEMNMMTEKGFVVKEKMNKSEW